MLVTIFIVHLRGAYICVRVRGNSSIGTAVYVHTVHMYIYTCTSQARRHTVPRVLLQYWYIYVLCTYVHPTDRVCCRCVDTTAMVCVGVWGDGEGARANFFLAFSSVFCSGGWLVGWQAGGLSAVPTLEGQPYKELTASPFYLVPMYKYICT